MRQLALLLACALLLPLFSGCDAFFSTFGSPKPTGDNPPLDYADPASWAYFAEGDGEVDVFFVAPTCDLGQNGDRNIRMTNETAKANFVGAINMQRGIYDDGCVLYAPFYRQATFPVFELEPEVAEGYLAVAYDDLRAAFLHFAALSERPFVLAGFSQGSDLLLRLVKELFGEPAYADRLVAAYLIGWRVTPDDTAECPWLVPAACADDTGVFVAFTSEAVDITDSPVVPAGTWSYSINPLNWRTDATPAAAIENRGACFTDYSGDIMTECMGFSGAYLDPERGTLKVTDIDPADYVSMLFPEGIYHLYDYQFFYRNLEENVQTRVAAFLAGA